MGRKITMKGLTRKLDYDLWSPLVKERAKNKCEVCGATENLQSHHIIGRSNWRLRWELKNGCCLCAKHHEFDSHQSAHKNSPWFNEWLKKYRPKDLEWLREHEMETKSWKRWEKEELVKLYESLDQKNLEQLNNFILPLDENLNLPQLDT
jgi:hypothetical protein